MMYLFIYFFILFPIFYHLQEQNCFKIKEALSVKKSPSPKQKEAKPSPSPKQKVVRPKRQSSDSDDMLKEAAETAAYIIAETENKSYLATEAVKETEKFSRMAEGNDAMLLLAEQLYEQCNVDKYSFLLVSECSNSMILNNNH